ncbi:MAG: hypothetical protein FWF05_02605 [Oscillospiraceae bacterium]|nr:hypothetical protein [Oscillospiraceae bacterium]
MEELVKCLRLAADAGKTVKYLTVMTKIVTGVFAALMAVHMVRGIMDLKKTYFAK